MELRTEQEEFWAGDFGNDYIERNKSDRLLASNLNYFTKSLSSAGDIRSAIEFGANVGMNIRSLKLLYPEIELSAIEINSKAVDELKKVMDSNSIYEGSILNYQPLKKFDLAFTKGVLIHINPEFLPSVYRSLYESTNKYILIGEYYNPVPTQISYRGHADRLFKRDFAGEMMSLYSDLELVSYGFNYKKDPAFSQDDITWFLLRKK